MHIEIRDQTLVERLNKLLPRPDAPYDEVIRTLLERPCKLKAAEIAQEVVERLSSDGRQAGRAAIDEEKLRAVVERAIVKAIESKIVEELKNVAEEAKKAFVDANAVEIISERAAAKAVIMAFESDGFRDTLNKIVGNAVSELIERAKGILAEQIKWAFIERIMAEQIKGVLIERIPEILRAVEEAGRGGWEAVIEQALKRPDKCLAFNEIRHLYRRDLNSEMLRSHGFVRKGKGIWCYVGEQKG